jgi:hypothetical protein
MLLRDLLPISVRFSGLGIASINLCQSLSFRFRAALNENKFFLQPKERNER